MAETFKKGDRVAWIEHDPRIDCGAAYHVKGARELYGAGPFTVASVEATVAQAVGHPQLVKIAEIAEHRFEGRRHDGVFSGAYFRKVDA